MAKEKVDFEQISCKRILSPCPFCRSESDKLTLVSGRSRSFVICRECNAFGPTSRSIDIACDLWNMAKDFNVLSDTAPYDDPFGYPDAHNCRAEADAYGICQVCGSIVHGSLADYELHGYDPPEVIHNG